MADTKHPPPPYVPPTRFTWERAQIWALFGKFAFIWMLAFVGFGFFAEWVAGIADPDHRRSYEAVMQARADILVEIFGNGGAFAIVAIASILSLLVLASAIVVLVVHLSPRQEDVDPTAQAVEASR